MSNTTKNKTSKSVSTASSPKIPSSPSLSGERLSRVDTSSEETKKVRRLTLSPTRIISSIARVPSLSRSPIHSRNNSVNSKQGPSIDQMTAENQSIEGISRSFVGFLTTASVYAGFQDFQDEEEENENYPPLLGYDNNDELSSVTTTNTTTTTAAAASPISFPKISITGLENTSGSPYSTGSTIHSSAQTPTDIGTVVQKRASKFELSVVNRLVNKDSDEACKKRATALSSKLKKTFEISEDDEFVGDYPCWLISEVLLQGHLYITKHYILFFAFLPNKAGSITKSGTLTTKSYPSMREHRKWAILRDNTLSLYASSTELYFPNLVIDLRTALRAEIHGGNNVKPNQTVWIRIITESRTHWFLTDNLDFARSWVSALKKQIFASRNDGGQVAIKIPLQNILDLELTTVIGITKNLRIKVIESVDTYAIDDYFLMFFSKAEEAVDNIRKVIRDAGVEISESSGDSDEDPVLESQLLKSKIKLLKKSSSTVRATAALQNNASSRNKSDIFISIHDNDDSSVNVAKEIMSDESKASILSDTSVVPEQELLPVPTARESSEGSNENYAGSRRNWSTRSLVKGITSITNGLIGSTKSAAHYDETSPLAAEGADPYFVDDLEARKTAIEHFHKHFSLNDSENLIASYHSYLVRGIPTYGKIYVGATSIFFRSLLPGSHTIMILPFSDVENINKEKGFRFGYSGLVLVIHGHEELFFEFPYEDGRDDCEALLLKQNDIFKKSNSSHTTTSTTSSPAEGDTLVLAESSSNLTTARIRMFENKINDELGFDVPIIIEDHPLEKTKIKVTKKLRFTLLTIGSRGDVQPYIALGKALKKEGHKVRIVTHAEFGDWVRKHGIEFDVIAGDPSELMALMVMNPNINYTFLKEAKSKFRTWIDDLLITSWKACQDTDVLIESPSSICGVHIAEKLQIPYFRAFTMPWSRTRAYPHAFMVPEQKLGGAYNYMTYVAFEAGYWRGTAQQINKWRVETLGLPKTTLAAMKQSSIPFLYNMSPVVFPPPVDFPEWVNVTGYWFLDEGNVYSPPQELVDFMKKAREDGKKLVYIGFGSIVVSNPKELSQAVVDAVVEADVRCILNKGWSDRLGTKTEFEIEIPPQVYNAGAVPHDWLFPQLDAAVHHGGSGTTGASLKFGLPTIIKPFFGDQKFYAHRVEDLGCGIGLKDLNYKSLAKALKEATTNTRMIEKAKQVGEKIRCENGVQKAIEIIYNELDYAKKLSVSKAKEVPREEDVMMDQIGGDNFEDSWLMV